MKLIYLIALFTCTTLCHGIPREHLHNQPCGWRCVPHNSHQTISSNENYGIVTKSDGYGLGVSVACALADVVCLAAASLS